MISFFIRGEGNVDIHFKNEIIDAGNPYAIPYIVAYEIKRWLLDKPIKTLLSFAKQFDALFENVKDKAGMPGVVWEKAVEIYIMLKHIGQLIGNADILIAAYCIVNGHTLVTDNLNDFIRIEGLKIVNWKN